MPNAGSFIRPTASGISYGTTFLKALVSKYIEAAHGSGPEKVVLGSSNGAIEVEAVNLDKIRGKLSNLQRLREVSLDNELVSSSDPPVEIRRTCPGKLTATANVSNRCQLERAVILLSLPKLEQRRLE